MKQLASEDRTAACSDQIPLGPMRQALTLQHARAWLDRRCALPSRAGERILRYWPTKEPLPVQSHSWSVCGMCEGAGDHACINCVGTGTVNRLPWEEGEEPQLGALTTVTAHEQGLGTAGH